MKSITRLTKTTGETENVTVKEFQDFVGTGTKKREGALTALIEGGLYQNTQVAYYLAPMRNSVPTK
ncbi:hypothetical protein [Paenibacillus taichungensis]